MLLYMQIMLIQVGKPLVEHLGTFDTVAYQCTDAAGNNSDLHFVDVHVRASNPNPSDVRTPITVELTPHSNGLPGNGVINNFVGTDRIVFLAKFSEPVSGFTVEDILSSYRRYCPFGLNCASTLSHWIS